MTRSLACLRQGAGEPSSTLRTGMEGGGERSLPSFSPATAPGAGEKLLSRTTLLGGCSPQVHLGPTRGSKGIPNTPLWISRRREGERGSLSCERLQHEVALTLGGLCAEQSLQCEQGQPPDGGYTTMTPAPACRQRLVNSTACCLLSQCSSETFLNQTAAHLG